MPVFPVRTATWMAACAAHDLHFWSDSPIAHTVWAVSDDQRFHLVRVNTADRTAVHVCREARYVPGMMEVFCAGDPYARSFTDPRVTAKAEGSMLAAAAALTNR